MVYHPSVKKPSSPWKIQEFKMKKGIKKPLQELSKMGYPIFIISNQPDVSRGHIEKGTTEKINKTIKNNLPINEIITCTHDDHHNCNCRKPKPGMIHDLSKKYNIDLKKSFLIGDNWKDIGAGENAGCISILLKTDYNKKVESKYKVEDIDEAVNIIKNTKKN